MQNTTIEELEQVDGVGKVVAESILAWFADEDNERLLQKFDELGVHPHYEQKTGKLVGQNFVVTGTLESMGRDDAADKIRALGGTFQTNVAKRYDLPGRGWQSRCQQAEKAEAYGTKIIDEQAFLQLLES